MLLFIRFYAVYSQEQIMRPKNKVPAVHFETKQLGCPLCVGVLNAQGDRKVRVSVKANFEEICAKSQFVIPSLELFFSLFLHRNFFTFALLCAQLH